MLGFRVWHKDRGRFASPLELRNIAIDCHGKLVTSALTNGHSFNLVDSEFFIPMQSTGLITEDHKPIFEGDIIGWEDGTHLKLVEDATTFVGRMGSSCKIQPDGKMILFYIHGNKYSNPELLEKVQC